MTRRLILLRHGQTEYNATKRMQSHLNTQLSEVGLAQAEAAADFLSTLNIAKIISSDLTRAFDTATAVGKRLGVDIVVDPRLRETNLGQWQDRSRSEIDAEYPGARAIWRHDATWAPPGGESRLDVARRARPVIDELMASFDEWDDSTVLIVAHGGTNCALTANLLGLRIDQYPMLSGLGNTCWAQLTARPEFIRPEDESMRTSSRFTPDNVANAQWYLDGWNMGVALGRASLGVSHIGEAGAMGG